MIDLIRGQDEFIFLRELDQPFTSFLWHAGARWVVKGGDEIKKLWAEFSQFLLKRFNDEPIFICINGNDRQMMICKYSECQKIGWLLNKDCIARPGEESAD